MFCFSFDNEDKTIDLRDWNVIEKQQQFCRSPAKFEEFRFVLSLSLFREMNRRSYECFLNLFWVESDKKNNCHDENSLRVDSIVLLRDLSQRNLSSMTRTLRNSLILSKDLFYYVWEEKKHPPLLIYSTFHHYAIKCQIPQSAKYKYLRAASE